MSLKHTESITCSKCGKESGFTAWRSLNTVLNPDEKIKVLNGELFRFTCPDCGYKAFVNYPHLYHAMDEGQIQEVLGTSESLLDGDKSVMAVLTARMVQEAGKGSYKHYETLRDTAGFKPKDEVDISADIMTDADRALLDKVGRRLNVKNG